MEDLINQYMPYATDLGIRLITALAIFIVGKMVARAATNGLKNVLAKRDVDPMLIGFVGNLVYFALLAFVIIAALGRLGIQTTSFVALLGAAGLAVGLALQGSLSNFAAGVLMLIFRPFKQGDFIEASGVAGSVEEIHIFTTNLKTPDNKLVIIPNSAVTAGSITNFSAKPKRRLDLICGVAYDADVDRVEEILWEEIRKQEHIMQDEANVVGLDSLGDSSVNFAVKVWVPRSEYLGTKFAMNKALKKRLDAEGIGIPFPQMDVHLIKQD